MPRKKVPLVQGYYFKEKEGNFIMDEGLDNMRAICSCFWLINITVKKTHHGISSACK